MNNEAWLKVHFNKESELQKHLVLLPDEYYSSGNRYPRQLLNKAVHKVLFSDFTVKL
jgi:hypothetical protein